MPLADVLAQLREQLAEAEQKAAGKDLKLTVKEIDVELRVTVKAEGKGKVSFNVWAADGELGGGGGREAGHTIRLKLDPKGGGESGDLNISGRRG
jgi:hypothetical protein